MSENSGVRNVLTVRLLDKNCSLFHSTLQHFTLPLHFTSGDLGTPFQFQYISLSKVHTDLFTNSHSLRAHLNRVILSLKNTTLKSIQ
jgi:hypothetical protein